MVRRIAEIGLCASLLCIAVAAGTGAKQMRAVPARHSLPPLPEQVENPNAYLYGYVMDVGVGTKYRGLSIVAIRPAGMHEAYWETLPICGKRGGDLNPAIGHWTVLVYSRDLNSASTFCHELHSVKIVE